jgi:tRNA (cmo5U34)-methyltransferase
MRDKWQDADFIRVWDARPPSLLRREQLDILASVIAAGYRRGSRILNLGCGTGKLEQLILAHLPEARFTSVDRSAPMIEVARARLKRYSTQIAFVQQDLSQVAGTRLPGRPFQFIVSVNVIHELPHMAKRQLFQFCRRNITKTGTLLVIDRIAIERRRLHSAYDAVLRRLQRLNGNASGELSSHFAAPGAPDHERPATLEQYLTWLRRAGFTPAVPHLHFHKALIAATPR